MSAELVVILLMGLAMVIFVGQPLVTRVSSPLPTDAAEQEIERLSVQKETLYTAIHDLDFDFQTGKVDREDYTAMRQRLESEAIEVLRQIDHVDPLADLDSELERQILALRQLPALPSLPATTAMMCLACGVRLHGNENFCPSCGHRQAPS
jgi:rubrerythrin